MGSVQQLSLPLPYRKAFDLEDFLLAPCNQEAVAWLDSYPRWPGHALMICGPKGCGKTHLAHIFSETIIEAADLTDTYLPEHVSKIVIENIEKTADEKALFHLFNWTKEKGIGVLMTARSAPDFHLPDLVSRMSLVPKTAILPPDDALMYVVLSKAFAERFIFVPPAVLEYAVKQVERSFPAVHALIEAADTLSLSEGRRITIPLMKQALQTLKTPAV